MSNAFMQAALQLMGADVYQGGMRIIVYEITCFTVKRHVHACPTLMVYIWVV